MPKVVINGRKQSKNVFGGATGKKRATTKSKRHVVRLPPCARALAFSRRHEDARGWNKSIHDVSRALAASSFVPSHALTPFAARPDPPLVPSRHLPRHLSS